MNAQNKCVYHSTIDMPRHLCNDESISSTLYVNSEGPQWYQLITIKHST